MLRWIEGFEAITVATLTRKYDEVSTGQMAITSGRGSGSALNAGYSYSYIKKDFDNQQTWIIGVAFRTPATLAHSYIIRLYDTATVQVQLRSYYGKLIMCRGATELEETGVILSTDTWYYIEFKVKIDNTVGTYEVKVNGTTVLSDTGVDTQETANAYANSIRFYGDNVNARFDDMYILDGTGAINNDFLGEMKVELLLPDGDTVSADWTPSAGVDHYAVVDENPVNDDTDYLETNTNDHEDIFTFEDLSYLGLTIYGLQINVETRVTDAASKNLRIPIDSNGLDYDIAQTVSSTDYKTFTRVSETDPDTSALWLYTAVNAADFGIQLVA